MSSGASSLSFLMVCFLVCSCPAQENITAELRKEVILPCKDPDKHNITTIRAVEWTRPDQEPDYVLLYRNGQLDKDSQHPSYQDRVDLQDKEMKDGDFSLILKNLTKNDTGRYECRVFEKRKNELINIIHLEVHLSAQEIRAELGKDVTLPCKDPDKYKPFRAVEWRRPGLDPDHVLVHQDGRLDLDNQHPSYQNRVDLQDKDMKDGDFSLLLKNVKMEDTGRYECWVVQKRTNRRKRSSLKPNNIINLEVVPPGSKDGIIAGSIVGGILLLSAASVGFLIYRRIRRLNQHISGPLDEAAAEQML